MSYKKLEPLTLSSQEKVVLELFKHGNYAKDDESNYIGGDYDKIKSALFTQSDCDKLVAKEQAYINAVESLINKIQAMQSDLKDILTDFIGKFKAHKLKNYPIQGKTRILSQTLDELTLLYEKILQREQQVLSEQIKEPDELTLLYEQLLQDKQLVLPAQIKKPMDACVRAFLNSEVEYGWDTLRERELKEQARQEKVDGQELAGEFQPYFNKLDDLVSKVKAENKGQEQAKAESKQLSPAAIAQKRIDAALEAFLNEILTDATNKISAEGNQARGIKCLCEELLIKLFTQRDYSYLDQVKFTDFWRGFGNLSGENLKKGGYGDQQIKLITEKLALYRKLQQDIKDRDFNINTLAGLNYKKPATAKIVNPLSQPVQQEPSVSFVKPELKQASKQVIPPKPLPEPSPIPVPKPSNILQQPTAPITQKAPDKREQQAINYVQMLEVAEEKVKAISIDFTKKSTLSDVEILKNELNNQINSIMVEVPINEVDSPAVRQAINNLETTKENKIAQQLNPQAENRKYQIIAKEIKEVSTDFDTCVDEGEIKEHKLKLLQEVKNIREKLEKPNAIESYTKSDLVRLVELKEQSINNAAVDATKKIKEKNKLITILDGAILKIKAFKFDFTDQDRPQSKVHLEKLQNSLIDHVIEVCGTDIDINNKGIKDALEEQIELIEQAYQDRLMAIDKLEEQRKKQLKEFTDTKAMIATATGKTYDFTNLNSGEVNQLKETVIIQLEALKGKLNSLSKLLRHSEPQEELLKIAQKQQNITEQAEQRINDIKALEAKAKEPEKITESPVNLVIDEQQVGQPDVTLPEKQNEPLTTITIPQGLDSNENEKELKISTSGEDDSVVATQANQFQPELFSDDEKADQDTTLSERPNETAGTNTYLQEDSEEVYSVVANHSVQPQSKSSLEHKRIDLVEQENNSTFSKTDSVGTSFHVPESSRKVPDSKKPEADDPKGKERDIIQELESSEESESESFTSDISHPRPVVGASFHVLKSSKAFEAEKSNADDPKGKENERILLKGGEENVDLNDDRHYSGDKSRVYQEATQPQPLPRWLPRLEQIVSIIKKQINLSRYDDSPKRNYVSTARRLVKSAIVHYKAGKASEKEVLDMFKVLMVCCFQNKKGNGWFNDVYTQLGCNIEKELRAVNYAALTSQSNDPIVTEEREKHIATEELRQKLFGEASFGPGYQGNGFLETNVLPNYQNMVNMIVEQQIKQYLQPVPINANIIPDNLKDLVKFTPADGFDVLTTASSLIKDAQKSTVEKPLTIKRLVKEKFRECYELIFKQDATFIIKFRNAYNIIFEQKPTANTESKGRKMSM